MLGDEHDIMGAHLLGRANPLLGVELVGIDLIQRSRKIIFADILPCGRAEMDEHAQFAILPRRLSGGGSGQFLALAWKFDGYFRVEHQIRVAPFVKRVQKRGDGAVSGAVEQWLSVIYYADRLVQIGHAVVEPDRNRADFFGRFDFHRLTLALGDNLRPGLRRITVGNRQPIEPIVNHACFASTRLCRAADCA